VQQLTRAAVAKSPAASSASGEKIKIGINGFGRIGRLVARLVLLHHRFTVD
jgi:phosphoglycerate dehydrogenase-like enzyme